MSKWSLKELRDEHNEQILICGPDTPCELCGKEQAIWDALDKCEEKNAQLIKLIEKLEIVSGELVRLIEADADIGYITVEKLNLTAACKALHKVCTAQIEEVLLKHPNQDTVPNDICLFDDAGYPTKEALERLATWEIKSFQDCADAMDFAGKLWNYKKYWNLITYWKSPINGVFYRYYSFSTCGWSGNESVIKAIEANTILQEIGAYSWKSGGHYEYVFPLPDIKEF